ncbi:helix-turn-helix domain-containing protein [Flagellimonas nanhaiensis]|nr:helix-turn-helix domain-containing protein [Allomuricauda nanhaiensis]
MSSESTSYYSSPILEFLNSLLHFKRKNVLNKYKLLLLFLTLFCSTTFIILYSWMKSEGEIDLTLTCTHILQLLLYGFVFYLLFKKTDILNNEQNDLASSSKKHSKYEKTGLSEAFSQELKSKLEYMMNTKKLYLKHNLKLDDIAEALDVSRHHASQVINANFSMNFHDFINSHRIEDAKNKLSSGFADSSDSISDIAYQCGFNNRVSFYKAFRKVTHSTPTEYMVKTT